MQFLDPTNDYSFKKIFGDERKKNILVSFLNSILGRGGERAISDVTLLNPTQAPHIKGAKETILDVRCHDQRGHEFIIEIQVLYKPHFDKRVLFYVSKAYSSQLNRHEDYDKLTPVIFLGILDFSFTENHGYLSTHRISEVETRERIFRDFEFTLVELPKFTKKEEELVSVADKWIYFLKHAADLNVVPEVIHEEALKEAFEVVNRINWSQEEIDCYENHIKAWRDRSDEIKGGYLKGIEKGNKDTKHEMALKLLQRGVDPHLISEVSGLSLAELAKLQS